MKVDLSDDIKEIVNQAVAEIKTQGVLIDDRIAYTEAQAASMLNLNPWQLAGERQRGRIGYSRVVGGKIRYTVRDLVDYLQRHRCEVNSH